MPHLLHFVCTIYFRQLFQKQNYLKWGPSAFVLCTYFPKYSKQNNFVFYLWFSIFFEGYYFTRQHTWCLRILFTEIGNFIYFIPSNLRSMARFKASRWYCSLSFTNFSGSFALPGQLKKNSIFFRLKKNFITFTRYRPFWWNW